MSKLPWPSQGYFRPDIPQSMITFLASDFNGYSFYSVVPAMFVLGPVTSDLHRYYQTQGFRQRQPNHPKESRQDLQFLPLFPHQLRNAIHCGHFPFQKSNLRFLSSAFI